ncbi:MAG: enoyl-CoA hydratase [Candidatus Marinimicrobia bacterium]|nr:enoyl-CoA hydratase [Candidatus Neomarinimicrobiota bacterium]|tara:strand:+ start:67 stop:822 length:756 start_codon:yes stop_codon:yes gene_type:complete
MDAYVNTEVQDGIGSIEFFHPQSNSLPGIILEQLASSITDAGKNVEIKVLILKSGGDRAFCAGASFNELLAVENEVQGKEFFSGFAKVINASRKCPKFIIGRVQGKAVGGGVGMASATDYCFATKYASVKLSELAIGIGPFVVGPPIERKIGMAAFGNLTINATEWHSAEWAREKGLYSELYNSSYEMDVAIQTLAEKLAASNPDSMQALKKVMWDGTEHWDELLLKRAAMSGKRVLSDFTRNTLMNLKKK